MAKQASKKSDGKDSKADVIKLLTADHKKVKKLFKEFALIDSKNNASKRGKIVKQICLELTIHAQVEEEIFYPAVRKAINSDDLMDEADVEHAGAKELVAQLEIMSPDESHYDAKVTVLRQYIKHHIKEEEDVMFPLIKKSKIDRKLLGEEISLFKETISKKMKSAAKPVKKAPAKTTKKPVSSK